MPRHLFAAVLPQAVPRRIAIVVPAFVVLLATAAGSARAQGTYFNASLAVGASAEGKTIGNIDLCSNQPPGVAPPPGTAATSPPATCSGTATHDNQTVIATSSSSASLSASSAGQTDRFGRPLFSSISISETVKAQVEFTGDVKSDTELGGNAGSSVIVRLQIVVETGTPYTITVTPNGNAQVEPRFNNALINGSVSPSGGGILDVRLTASIPSELAPGGAAPVDGSVEVSVTFGSIPPIGACCRTSCFVDTTVACGNSGGSFRGGGTTCNPNPCVAASGSPTPSTTPTPSNVFTWVNPAGGSFGTAANWQPPQVPTSNTQRDDTAVFDISGAYGLNVAGATAKRFIIRNSSIDLVGGTAQVTSTVPTEPSLVVGQNGKLHLVSGTFTSVDSVLGDVSGGLAEVDLIANDPVWNNTGKLTIGDAGPGRLTIVSGEVTSGDTRIGGGLLGAGAAIVGGSGVWNTSDFGLGFGGGAATLEVRDQAFVGNDAASVGVTADASVTVTGGTWDTNNLAVGRGGVGTVTLASGGSIISDDGFVGFASTPGSSVTVDGTGAQFDTSWTVSGRLVVGAGPLQQPSDLQPDATLDVVGGGHVETKDLEISGKGDGKVSVDGVDAGTSSLVEVSGVLIFGGSLASSGGQGVLGITDGGRVQAKQAKLGGFNFGVTTIAGRGPGGERSTLHVDQDVFVGVLGGGLVEVVTGGLLESASGGVASFEIGRNATAIIGTTTASDPTATWKLTGGDLGIGSSEAVGESAVVVHRSGEIVLGGSGLVLLRETGLLGGGGRIKGDVVVGGGRLAPLDLETRVPTRFTIEGDLDIEFGTTRIVIEGTQPDFFDTIVVTGNTHLAGTLEIFFANGFVPKAGDTFPFLQVAGTVTGSFAQVQMLGVRQGLPFTLTPSGIVITAAPANAATRTPVAPTTNALVLTTLADGVPCTVPDQDGDDVAECETCDNCVDDNGDGLVDAADPDCVPAADGGGASLDGTPERRKAIAACQNAIHTAAAKLAQGIHKGLTTCAAAVGACRQLKPDDAKCLRKAVGSCAKSAAALSTGPKTVADTFAAKLRKACGTLPFDDVITPTGLGFASAAARCARFGVAPLDGVDALARCIAREEQCRVTDLVRAALPHLPSLAAAGGLPPELLTCALDGSADGTLAGDGSKAAKALRKCQNTIVAAAGKLEKAIATSRRTCAAGMLACRQLSADRAACTAKAAAKCRAAATKLGDPATGSGAAQKLDAAVAKACGDVPLADLLGTSGLGFAGRADDCDARGVGALDSAAAIARCLARRVECGTTLRLTTEAPRLPELLELGATPP